MAAVAVVVHRVIVDHDTRATEVDGIELVLVAAHATLLEGRTTS